MSEYKPKNIFAGPFQVVTEMGTATAEITKMQPVTEAGAPVASGTIANVIGIAATDAVTGEEFTYYATGEYFKENINLPEGVTIEAVRPYLRKLNIYIR